MTTPAASVLGRVRAVIEAVQEMERNKLHRCDCGADLLDKPDCEGCRGMGWYHTRESLAALPVATDEGAVASLARKLHERHKLAVGDKMWAWDSEHGETMRMGFEAEAIWVLTELLAGGNDGGK